ncbi:MAG: 30S ribosomal protein S3 [Candidatus Altiarchaeota archaeon]
MAMERHFIQEGVIRSEIESYLRKELNRAGYSGINIQKTPLSTRVTLYVEKPPLVIGRKGKRINEITTLLREKYGIENPEVDVQRIENPLLDPNILSRRIAVALERGMNRRRVAYKAIRAVMSTKARGIEIILSGKISGKGGRSRVEKYGEGYMKKAGDSLKLVQIGSTQANLKAGVIGVTVKIVLPGTKFPDQIGVLPIEDPKLKKEEELAKKPKGEPEGTTEEQKDESSEKKKNAKEPQSKETEESPVEAKTKKGKDLKKEKSSDLSELKGLGAKAAEKLNAAGIKSKEELAKAEPKTLAEKTGLSEKKIEGWKGEIKK